MFEQRFISFAKRMHRERPWLWKLICTCVKHLHFKGMSWDECEIILNAAHADVHSSCLTHRPPSSCEVDLQIVVPVYNVENTLAECLDSVLNQKTRFSYRITVVNDGSTDSSLTVATKYAADGEIDLFSQENRGLSGARNAALDRMCGRYVLFLDSDDRLAEGAIDALMDATLKYPDADIVDGSYRTFRKGYDYIQTYNQAESFPAMNPIGYPWGKAIKSQVFENIQWPEGYWYEDVLMSMVLFQHFKVASVSNIVYDYRLNPQGIVSRSFGNVKSLDSYYITRQLLADNGNFTSQRYYDCFLEHILINRGRVSTIGRYDLSKAVFFQTCYLRDKYFFRMHTDDTRLLAIEKALWRRNYIYYEIQ